ncbi:MAG TPA: hypothetical protein VH000_04955 [Rhizomicrobium sp.]|jgi:tetratricopeptide (TPR) repeat protein|nr:hypothetical protein [Rhizomicrobium sp.]
MAIKLMFDNCQNQKLDADARIEACSNGIHSNLFRGPFLSVIYLDRALAYEDKKDTDSATNDFAQAISLDATNAFAFNDRGIMRAQQNDMAGAAQDFDAAGIQYLKAGKCPDALREYGYELQVDPHRASGLYGKGLCEQRTAAGSGQADMTAALAADPHIDQTYGGLGITP